MTEIRESVRAEDGATRQATELMAAFADRTGLTADRPPRRYLWTDAFAVCNFLALARATGDARYTDLALRLVDQVHYVLGRHRPEDARTGWISGLGDREGAEHPTRGGLRIGKPLPERRAEEPLDEHLEWDRDGQYFHYLTKWMHALDQVSRATGDARFHAWARELAHVAHAAFVRGPPGARRMVWKMSTDLSRPLVSSTGQHDPLDGFLTCLELETSGSALPREAAVPSLARATMDFAALIGTVELRTADPLGLGGLLADAARLAQIMEQGRAEWAILLESLLAAAHEGLARYAAAEEWRAPAPHRLAFRELGLAIGLSALELLRKRVAADTRRVFARAELHARIEALAREAPLGTAIVSFWIAPEHRRDRTFLEHRDINEVMLATSLLPEGFVVPY